MGTHDSEKPAATRRPSARGAEDDPIRRVVLSYDDPVIRTYSYLRFKIFRQRFLDEIGQYLPRSGRVLDVGCGFGLFSLYYAQILPEVRFHGFDLNSRRVEIAQRAASRLGLDNVSYSVSNALELSGDDLWSGVYMLDVVHHLPQSTVRPMLEEVRRSLSPGARLVIKDLDTSPAWKRVYSHALDWAMSPSAPVRYWGAREITRLLDDVGFDVYQHAMVDYLPYPHMLYVCTCR